MDVPPDAHKPLDVHEEAINRSLDRLDAAVSSGAKPETYGEIARSVRGAALALLEDAKRLNERATFFEHYGRGSTD